jgi:type I restriction enzyme, S subunit
MLKPYCEYKLSSSAFERKIPSHWNEYKMSWLFDFRNDKNHVDEELLSVYLDKGVVSYTSTTQKQVHKPSEDLSNYQLVLPGDFVLNNQQAWRGSVGISKYRGIISPAYYVLKPRIGINSDFLNYAGRDKAVVDQFVIASKGVGSIQRQIYIPYLKNVVIQVPPKSEQDQIVRYLDWKVSEMNRFIHEKKKQIKLLEELKYTQIDRYITKGLNPPVLMKDSQVEWIGKIPEHWKIDHIKQHFTVKKRIAGKEGYDVLSITQQGLKVKDISSNEGQMAQNYSGYQFVYPGDFAMNHMDLITGYVDLSDKFGVTSPDYRVFTLDDTENCYAPYYLRVFQIGYKRKIFYKFGKGAANQGRWRMPKNAFYDYSIQVPPMEEQRQIEEACQKLEQDIDDMISGIQKEITLVEELRTKLIADVVTGQVDVRDEIIPDYTSDFGAEALENDSLEDEDEEFPSEEE